MKVFIKRKRNFSKNQIFCTYPSCGREILATEHYRVARGKKLAIMNSVLCENCTGLLLSRSSLLTFPNPTFKELKYKQFYDDELRELQLGISEDLMKTPQNVV